MIDFVTKNWQNRWVTTDISDEEIADALLQRPFFLLVSVDAPVSIRWIRFKARFSSSSPTLEPPDLSAFVIRSDAQLYSSPTRLALMLLRAQLRILNSGTSISALRAALSGLNLTDESRLRPGWDQYFMQLASLAAQRSNCMKRRVGCVLVRDRRVVSTGYNGTPRHLRNCIDGGCPRCNAVEVAGAALSTCFCLHAEENALLEAGRDRIHDHTILYCDTCPCLTCSIKIAQVGIAEVVYSQTYSMDSHSATILGAAGVTLRQFVPLREGPVYLGESYARAIQDVGHE